MTGVTDGWEVRLSRKAEKDLTRLDPPVKRRVLSALVQLQQDPRGATSVRKLTGRAGSRLRVGDWRVIFDVSFPRREIYVVRILPRGRAYER